MVNARREKEDNMGREDRMLKDIEDVKSRGKGRSELIAYLEGKDLTAQRAIKAKCYDCMGFYVDGNNDCGMVCCALYPFMPYNPKKRVSKVLTDDQKNAMKERAKKSGFGGRVKSDK
jgi:hypothetical protein